MARIVTAAMVARRQRPDGTGVESGAMDPAAETHATDLAVETHALTRSFGDLKAVDGIDLAVPKGSFYGFLGPNGAGKSTTIKCLTGLLKTSSGSIRILGLDPATAELEVKRQVGVIGEEQALFERLSGAETLELVGRVHGLERADWRRRSDELLQTLDLAAAAGKLVADYSTGMRKKLALAVALLPAPHLLFLDEPFEGVDPVASRQIREILRSYVQRGGTVFLTSHILEIVERLADHIGVISRGRLVAQGTLESLVNGAGVGRSLEETFIELVGGGAAGAPALDWLG
jgi:ABC-2 type transport system ATP-binding protein